MKTAQELFNEHLTRLSTAVALGKPDRVPVVAGVDAFCAHHMGMTIAEYISDQDKSSQVMANSVADLGDVDAALFTTTFAKGAGPCWMAESKLPGRELGINEPWQVHEVGIMTDEDYDTIINKGYFALTQDVLQNRLPQAGADWAQYLGTDFVKSAMYFVNKGIIPFCPVMAPLPYDVLCGARGMIKFTRDLFKMPDKVQAAADVIQREFLEISKQAIRAAKPFSVWLGGTRCASEFISPKVWNRFAWPYIKEAVAAYVAEGTNVYLHFDANWDRDLEHFRDLPKGKVIFGCDHATNIYKIKEVLGDHMCIFGDVPASILAIGTPDDVYNYCTKLIAEIGPSGFILAAACNVPANASVENAKALVAAASGK
ncbi:MAG TPA: uroporphyrinogen decarboxylase family protein [Negativicutes bacterium]|jgi:hypothetical protein